MAEETEKFYIPIEEKIKEFRNHLDSHDRTILSARFGDGKSYFLSRFMSDRDVKDGYEFITLFPVNYQVTENKDIFELVKRDILLQMFMKGIIQADDDLKSLDALALYVQNEPLSFLGDFLPLLSSFDMPEEYAELAVAAKTCKNIYEKIKKGIKKYKTSERSRIVEDFFDEIEKNPIVGTDAISRLIHEGIKTFKKKNKGKKVVLVIEDMDRIDPAHLFRILNVLSAHIDYCYRLGIRPDESLLGNKFGFDKIVLVLNYKNLEHIYYHFYGKEATFDGYIDKFCSSNYFEYSLQQQRESLVYKRISQNTGMPISCLEKLIRSNEITDSTIRQIVKAIEDTEKLVLYVPEVQKNNGRYVKLHKSVPMLIALLRKMRIGEKEIQDRIVESILVGVKNSPSFISYIAPYLTLALRQPAISGLRYSSNTNSSNYFQIDDLNDDGSAVITNYFETNYDNQVDFRIRKAVKYIMDEMVSK